MAAKGLNTPYVYKYTGRRCALYFTCASSIENELYYEMYGSRSGEAAAVAAAVIIRRSARLDVKLGVANRNL